MADNPMTYDLAPLRRILDEYGGQKGAVIPILQRVQEAYGYLPKELLAEISKRTGIPLHAADRRGDLLCPISARGAAAST